MMRAIAVAALLASCSHTEVPTAKQQPKEATVDPRRRAEEDVFAKLVAGQSAEIPDLGSFVVREYKAYEGRNPRTGETVSVPAKRLPFFKVSAELRSYANGDGKAPATPWVAKMVGEMDGKTVLFGRVGAFRVVRKAEATADDPRTGSQIVIPERAVVTFQPSIQLKHRLNDQREPRVVDATSVDSMLARLPKESPRTLAELDAALAKLGIEHRTAGLVEPGKRKVDDETVLVRDADDEPTWYLEGKTAVHRDAEHEVSFPIARWAGDMLVVAAARSAAGDGLLGEDAAARVLARLGPDSPFAASDLPY